MKREKLIAMSTLLIVMFCLTGLTFAAEEKAEEVKIINKIITINSEQGVNPTTLSSKPGTTVIWVNYSRRPAEILFLDKKVVMACSSPVNFFIGKDGAYESAKIPFGGTASLCFTEKGKYEYINKSSATFYQAEKRKDFRGVIWIK